MDASSKDEEYRNGVRDCTSSKDSEQWLTHNQMDKSMSQIASWTTHRGSTGESPFLLVYGTEDIIPAELGTPSHRILNFSEESNRGLLKENLDLIEELREKTFIRAQRYKNIMINSYNKRVKAWSFQVGDLVLRRVDTLKPVEKLDPTWEGPYKVTGIIDRGAYELEDLEGRPCQGLGTFTISKNITYEDILLMNETPSRDKVGSDRRNEPASMDHHLV
ncbi:UNVERIFIED_CONTAM: hypothetical protein Slati_2169400 [Sesamum latifolium]|uniref:Gag-pol polyprotein n=1 Tax=Sesamum latifolium TaxID=2727402 RepID=A0AAW2WVA5_9LAMI